MKKEYSKPNMLVVELQRRSCLLLHSQVQRMGSNAGISYGGSDDECEEVIIK